MTPTATALSASRITSAKTVLILRLKLEGLRAERTERSAWRTPATLEARVPMA